MTGALITDGESHVADTYDIVVLGGGSGGYATALRATELGLSVALIEADKVGGTCLHYGCIPTKAFLHAAEVADAAHSPEDAWHGSGTVLFSSYHTEASPQPNLTPQDRILQYLIFEVL